MKLTTKRIHDTVTELVGEDAIRIVKYLSGKKNISEFKIAEATKKEIHETRNILYRLYNHNLATYYRKKDREKGWYISYWTFNKDRVRELITSMRRQKLEKLRERLKQEQENENSFFMCRNMCSRLDFDNSVNFNFRCPECGNLMDQHDNSRTINTIKDRIKELNGMV